MTGPAMCVESWFSIQNLTVERSGLPRVCHCYLIVDSWTLAGVNGAALQHEDFLEPSERS